jgi:hypothetical protein
MIFLSRWWCCQIPLQCPGFKQPLSHWGVG